MATFGNLIAGVNAVQAPPTNNKAVSKFTLDRAGAVEKIQFDFSVGATGNAKAVIYDDDGSSGLPGTLLGTSDAIVNPAAAGTTTFSFSSSVTLAVGDYWIGLIADCQPTASCETLTNGIKYNSDTYSDGPTTPFGASPTNANYRYPINAIYTPTLTAGTYYGEITGGDTLSEFAANNIAVIPITPSVSGTVSKLTFFIDKTYSAAKVKGVIYDATGAGGKPGALLGTTTELVGPLINGNDLTFASPVALSGGVNYYIGLINDTAMQAYAKTGAPTGYYNANTYTSGPPNPFPTSPSPSTIAPCLWATFTATAEVANKGAFFLFF